MEMTGPVRTTAEGDTTYGPDGSEMPTGWRGEFGGDTWHASEEDARAHAVFEYGDALLLPWMEVPDEIATRDMIYSWD